MLALLMLGLGMDYAHQEILIPGAEPIEWRYAHVSVLTDDGTVGGYAAPQGGNGMNRFGNPFVWKAGKASHLPLGEYAFGHVQDVRGDLAVGDVVGEGGKIRPALWRPHPSKGWAAAQLEVRKDEEGTAWQIDTGGKVWVSSESGPLSIGSREKTATEKFNFAGADARGRLYGTRYQSLGIGFVRKNVTAVRFADGKWEEFGAPKRSEFVDVNRFGVAAGVLDGKVGIWRADRFEPFPANLIDEGGHPEDINDKGDVVGAIYKRAGGVPTLWRDGVAVALPRRLEGAFFHGAEAINERGQIVVSGFTERKARLFLLSPKP